MNRVDNILINSGLSLYRTVDGSTFNGFEYFYTIWEHNKNTKWILLKPGINYLSYLKDFLTKKYNFDTSCLDNIELYSLKRYLELKPRNLLYIDYTSVRLDNEFFLAADNYFVLSGFDKKLNKKNVKYFCEYDSITPPGESINYKAGIRFDLFKPLESQANKTLLNINQSRDRSYGEQYIYRSQLNSPRPQELFNKMIYIQNPPLTDTKPRLFHECKFFKIPYKFIFKGIKDGAYYRYYDAKSETIQDRLLTPDNILVKEFI